MPSEIDLERARQLLQQIDLGPGWDILVTDLSDDIAEIYADGMTAALPLTGADISVAQINARALEYAQEHAAELVTLIEANTRDLIRDDVAMAISEGWSADELREAIAGSTGFSDDRAMMIARTELIDANNQGNLAGYREAARQGIGLKKEWLTAGDDLVSEDCEENEDAGPIPLEDDFPSGDDAPPAHPNCRCAIAPVLADEQDDTQDVGDTQDEEEG